MMHNVSVHCADEVAMRQLGAALMAALPERTLLTLSGELGAGKSYLARAMIHATGYVGRVKSPTYTLIETYDVARSVTDVMRIAHMDLYRLADPDELHYLGFDDVLRDNDLVMIEWPEQAAERLPAPTVTVAIEYAIDGGRQVLINSEQPLNLDMLG